MTWWFAYYACPRWQPSICWYCASPNVVQDQQAYRSTRWLFLCVPTVHKCQQVLVKRGRLKRSHRANSTKPMHTPPSIYLFVWFMYSFNTTISLTSSIIITVNHKNVNWSASVTLHYVLDRIQVYHYIYIGEKESFKHKIFIRLSDQPNIC